MNNSHWMKTTERNLPHCEGWYFIEHLDGEDIEISLVKVKCWESGPGNEGDEYHKLGCETLDGDDWNFFVSWFIQYTGQNPPPEPRIGHKERYGK